MCTIITADSSIDKKILIERVIADSLFNGDGFSMLVVMNKPLFIQSMDIEPIISLINSLDYERVFIHTRYATAGEIALQNCHGWNTKGNYVFHNGSITANIADIFDVDSMAINHWLENYGLDETVNLLLNERFANVFMVDMNAREYVVTRSSHGSLFTDGRGNYSTNAFAEINQPVDHFQAFNHVMELNQLNFWTA